MAFSRQHKRTRSHQGKARQSLYKTPEWKRLRARQLKLHPNCQCPHCKNGQPRKASIVDHRKAPKGDTRKFFDPNNLQSMNKECHDRFKQSQESGGHGFMRGCNASGEPLSAEHDWYG